MTITSAGTPTSNNTDNVASMVLNVPTGVSDDDLILFMGSCDGTGYSLPTGFIQIFDTAHSSNASMLAYRKASSEPASYTINVKTGTERGIGIFAIYSGVDVDAGPDVSSSNTGTSSTGSITSITPSEDNELVVAFIGTEDGNAGNPITTSWPSSLVSLVDNVNGPPGSGAGSAAGAFAAVIQTTAGAVSGSIALSITSTWATLAASFKESAAIGGTILTHRMRY